jgi:hypothetical protein
VSLSLAFYAATQLVSDSVQLSFSAEAFGLGPLYSASFATDSARLGQLQGVLRLAAPCVPWRASHGRGLFFLLGADLDLYEVLPGSAVPRTGRTRDWNSNPRAPYSASEDAELLAAVAECDLPPSGNELWKLVAARLGARRSWQSLRHRYLTALRERHRATAAPPATLALQRRTEGPRGAGLAVAAVHEVVGART